jgi:hypothetical protein
MNLAQRRHAAEFATQSIPTGAGGYWVVCGSALTFSGHVWPRGTIVPTELIEQIEHGRLGVMIANRLLAHRLGKPPADPPRPHPLAAPIDPAVALAEQRASLRRDGYAEWETTAGVPTPAGPFASATHPSQMVQPTRLPISIGGGYIDDK